MKFMSNFEAPVYGIFRAVCGFLFLWHGTQKLFDFPDYNTEGMQLESAWLYAGGSIELFGGALIMVGLFTRFAAFIASGSMAVAFWMIHAPKTLTPFDPLSFLPIVNKGELAVMFCFAFLYISCRGSGPFSIDRIRQ